MKKTTKTHLSKEKHTPPISEQDIITPTKTGNNKFVILFVLLAVLIGLIVVQKITGENSLAKLKKQVIPDAIKKVINNPDTKFTIDDIRETNGVYEMSLSVSGQKYTSYMTKDAKILFISGVKLDTLNNQTKTSNETAKKLTCNDLKKTDSPNLTAFIVADCPFGLQMQRVFKKTISEAPEMLSSLTVKYIGSIDNGKITSMHGDKEAQENLKQICIREEQKPKYWDYVSCYMQEGKSDECSTTSGIDTTQLSSCISDANRGLKYAKVDFDLANKLSVGSSPTLVLNDNQVISEFDFDGRVANSLSQIVCCASNTKPGFCSKELSKTELATAYSKTDEASVGSGSNAANCGTN